MKRCEVCGKDVKPAKRFLHVKRFCSDTCRIIGWAEKKKIEINKEALREAQKGMDHKK